MSFDALFIAPHGGLIAPLQLLSIPLLYPDTPQAFLAFLFTLPQFAFCLSLRARPIFFTELITDIAHHDG